MGSTSDSYSSSQETLATLESNTIYDFIPSYINLGFQKELKLKIIRDTTNPVVLEILGSEKFGFIENKVRSKCWHCLLSRQLRLENSRNNDVLIDHPDENQINLDVKRSFSFVENTKHRDFLKDLLSRIIIGIFRKHPKLRYYQGYHDIVSLFILVWHSNEEVDLSLSTMILSAVDAQFDTVFECVEIFTLVYLRDFMMNSLDFPIDQLKLISHLIKEKDPDLYHSMKLDKISPFFAISSILTFFSHDLKPTNENSIIWEIFDLIISKNSSFIPILIFTNFILMQKQKLIDQINLNTENFDNETDLIHASIQQILLTSISNENFFFKIMTITRLNYNRDVKLLSKVLFDSRIINCGSPLLTTAKGNNKTLFDTKDIDNLIDKQIKINGTRKNIRQTNTRFNIVLYHVINNKHLLVKLSILVGLLAIISKFSNRNLIWETYHKTKKVWLDPLHCLLHNPTSYLYSNNN
ncbi:hypothetical protein KAFR_0C03460 [Kazachstania africana CBS 2517]|uniref:Rab-GAP TBC domain-containing protein n=1 Tax=Kazachstania africana (strain ATCC 22294 / BCRC 22015 / CBS 2517 / CECT 1963 / NBRC 1671 / NRRL Y-8276) TaxID=1071382 RepID=H2ASI8_KAZAF|nr:hypothetical protein KAFR_0C03460 [Kazachstania africana CBS 2517]CCF57338.1 hypothetical protein KAFR_0C03460 [Kazachstania africana CBS 2517]